MKIWGFVIWINDMPVDKWIASTSVFVVPLFTHFFLQKRQVKLRKIILINVFLVIIHVGWLWSTKNHPYYYVYIEGNKDLSPSYLVHESSNVKHTIEYETGASYDVFSSKYTLFKSINPILFRKDSVREYEPGLIKFHSSDNFSIKKGENESIYIDTKYKDILVK